MDLKKLFSFFKKKGEEEPSEVKIGTGLSQEKSKNQENNEEETKEESKSLKSLKNGKGVLVLVGVFLVLTAFGFTFYKTHYGTNGNDYSFNKEKRAVKEKKTVRTVRREKTKSVPRAKANFVLKQKEGKDLNLRQNLKQVSWKREQEQKKVQKVQKQVQQIREQKQEKKQEKLNSEKLNSQMEVNPKAFQEFYLSLLKEAVERKKKELLALEEEVEKLKEEREKLISPIVIRKIPKQRKKKKKEEILFPIKVKAIICHDRCVAFTNFGPLKEGEVLGSEKVVRITNNCVITTKRKLCM